MSSKNEDIDADPARQFNSTANSEISHLYVRLLTLACRFMEVVLLVVTEVAARNIGRRLELLSRAAILPDASTYADTAGVAAYMDMEMRGAQELLKRNNVPSKKPGKEPLFRLSDLTEKFDPPE